MFPGRKIFTGEEEKSLKDYAEKYGFALRGGATKGGWTIPRFRLMRSTLSRRSLS